MLCLRSEVKTLYRKTMCVFTSIFCLLKSLNFSADSIVSLRSGNGWVCSQQKHLGMWNSFQARDMCVNWLSLWEVLVESGASLSEPAHAELFELSILLSSVELLACEPEWYLKTINGKCCRGSPSARLQPGITWQPAPWCWQTDSSSIIKPLVRLNTASCLWCSEHKAAKSLFFACPWLVTSCNPGLGWLSCCTGAVCACSAGADLAWARLWNGQSLKVPSKLNCCVCLCSAQHAEVLIFQQEMSAFCSSHENAFSTSG